jgi:hypothetical protein
MVCLLGTYASPHSDIYYPVYILSLCSSRQSQFRKYCSIEICSVPSPGVVILMNCVCKIDLGYWNISSLSSQNSPEYFKIKDKNLLRIE